ncbi:MAG: hypothetical protein RMI91_11620 [Gemmatales bacterium]|nr:hypothetical protein [Gemmatales bacterium]MDW7995290.1 hypothetical protein [Gemmatales bacterium]
MKAAQRKPWETSYLGDQLGKLVQWDNPHLAVWLAALIVGALVALAYWAVPRQARERMTYSWRELWESESRPFAISFDAPEFTASAMKELAERHKGTPVRLPALFAQAQAEQALALRQINNYEEAVRHLDEAERLYRMVLDAQGLGAEMRVRAYLGLAQTAETRFWLEKAKLSPTEQERRWKQLLAKYEETLSLAQRELQSPAADAHPLVQEVEAHLKRLRDSQTQGLVFFEPSAP